MKSIGHVSCSISVYYTHSTSSFGVKLHTKCDVYLFTRVYQLTFNGFRLCCRALDYYHWSSDQAKMVEYIVSNSAFFVDFMNIFTAHEECSIKWICFLVGEKPSAWHVIELDLHYRKSFYSTSRHLHSTHTHIKCDAADHHRQHTEYTVPSLVCRCSPAFIHHLARMMLLLLLICRKWTIIDN